MEYGKPKTYYTHHPDGIPHRLITIGYTMDTHQKRVVLKDLSNGNLWDLAYSDLFETKLVDGKPLSLWEKMPDGWFPPRHEDIRNAQQRSYQGYTNDPRREREIIDGYDVYGRPVDTDTNTYNVGGRRVAVRRR